MKTVFPSASRRIAALLLLLVLLLPLVSPFAVPGVERAEATVPARLAGSPDEELITESDAYLGILGELLKCKAVAKTHTDKYDVVHYYICVDVNAKDFGLSEDNLNQIFQALFYSEAELFFLTGGYFYTKINGVVQTVSSICVELPAPASSEELKVFRDTTQSQLAEFRELTRAITTKVDPSFSEWEKVAFVHDYVALHYDYDHDLEIYDAYGMLKNGIGVCQAYSLLTRYLLRKLGVECECVS
ncbi:MAG: transglutaminase domain-containing protein, partial [Clostridia bacterium]|nr:transglutaminase domain-containing protein [Clostridia bacterium]